MMGQVFKPPEDRVHPHNKRSLFGFIGEASHYLFGTATDKSVDECKKLIKATQVKQGEIIHRFNEFTSILNQTFDEIMINRNRINEIGDYSKVAESVYELKKRLSANEMKISKLQVMLNVEIKLNLIEAACDKYVAIKSRYLRQKAALEAGRLTEDLLSPNQLKQSLKGVIGFSVMMMKLPYNGITNMLWWILSGTRKCLYIEQNYL